VKSPSHDQLVAALRAGAEGSHPAEAAVELLIAHDLWPHRGDFLATAVTVTPALDDPGRLLAFIDWPAALAAYLPASSSEWQILALAAELAGVDSGRPLSELLGGLDDGNTFLVLRAVVHFRQGVKSQAMLVAPFARVSRRPQTGT
jgi:hypothetical protein